jgi:RNA polymerase sigma-70 factor, ECF subfamily
MPQELSPNELLELVYNDLRTVAERYFRRQPPGFTLSPTEIVHEAFIHFAHNGHADWTSTGHFRAIAICKMWQVVVDHLKRRHAQKRNGCAAALKDSGNVPSTNGPGRITSARKRFPLEDVSVEWHDRDVDLLDLADALADLGEESSRLRDVVTLHWFGRMTHAEVAQELGVSTSTAEKDFRYALAWLNRRLQGGLASGN